MGEKGFYDFSLWCGGGLKKLDLLFNFKLFILSSMYTFSLSLSIKQIPKNQYSQLNLHFNIFSISIWLRKNWNTKLNEKFIDWVIRKQALLFTPLSLDRENSYHLTSCCQNPLSWQYFSIRKRAFIHFILPFELWWRCLTNCCTRNFQFYLLSLPYLLRLGVDNVLSSHGAFFYSFLL